MKKQSKLTYFIVTLAFFSTINLYFSELITSKIAHGWDFSSVLFKIVYVQNTGAAFSILENATGILIVLSIIAIAALCYYALKQIENITPKEIFFLSFLISGIAGNLYERLVFGYVRDFFDLSFINFPIFNISDVFINIGVFGIIILILFTKKQKI